MVTIVIPAEREVIFHGDLLLMLSATGTDNTFRRLSCLTFRMRYPWFDGTLTDKQWKYLIDGNVEMLSEAGRENFNAIEFQEMIKKEHELRQWKYDYSFLKEKKVNDASSIVFGVGIRSLGYG